VPVAVNCRFVPDAIEGLAGVTAIDARVAEVTFSVVDPLTVSELAEIVVVPTPFPMARPALDIVATPVAEELQVTALVRFWVLPSV